MPRSAVDLKKLGEAFWNAFSSKRMGDAKRHWDEIMQTLAVGDEKVADSKTGEDEDVRVAKVPEQLRAVVAPTKDLRFTMIADGETVLPKMTVCVIDNVAYAADGTNEARMANGICVRAGNKRGEIYWRPTGVKVLARVKRNTGVDTYGVLYQSGTPGVLTNDPDEVGLAYVQQVAHFRNWEIRRDGQRPSIAEVDIMLSGKSGGNDPAWGDITGDIEDQTDLQAALDDKINKKNIAGTVTWDNVDGVLTGSTALGEAVMFLNPDTGTITADTFDGIASSAGAITPVGTAGQFYMTNAAGDGAEWGDGLLFVDGGSIADTYVGSPFDIDGGELS